MKAEVYLIDDNGKRVTPKPTVIDPMDTRDNGIVTTYEFAFEFRELDKEAFKRLAEVQK